ncbi:centromere protein N [Solea solea]|uniref:centromere protein N n=1 Tax=Solea solea TaxID=90069 RepID=UPI00272D1CA1|nr:centromere protein N [Solea solea]
MDDPSQRLLRQLLRRIPAGNLKTTLEKWGRLTAAQWRTIDFTQTKSSIVQMLALCAENEFTMKHITELEMMYVIDNPNKGMWYAFQLIDPEADSQSLELTQFKEQFKSHLCELVRHVSVKIKKHTDEAVWIRIAWGDSYSRPNHLKPTYIVHHLQTPYVFVTGLSPKQRPLVSQALVLSSRYHAIKAANLSGRNLTAIRDLLMKQYQQVFPTRFPSPLSERNQSVSNPQIEREHAGHKENRLQMASETFGDGMLPQLQSSVYKLETKFRDRANQTMTEREEPFKCVVKFASTNLLESLKLCVSSGIASTPVTPLLSSIPLKGRNYFVITDNGPAPSSQMPLSQN